MKYLGFSFLAIFIFCAPAFAGVGLYNISDKTAIIDLSERTKKQKDEIDEIIRIAKESSQKAMSKDEVDKILAQANAVLKKYNIELEYESSSAMVYAGSQIIGEN